MTTTQIDWLNIGLMLLSAALAIFFPFQLFLFAYAVLGPLHYLTEIAWLHQRNYFTRHHLDFVILSLLCSLVILNGWYFQIDLAGDLGAALLFVGFSLALLMLFVKSILVKLFAAVILLASTFFLSNISFYLILFAVFVPTIIHTLIFTASFILLGAMRSRSLVGILSLSVFVFCCFFLLMVHFPQGEVDGYIRQSYRFFEAVNFYLAKLFGMQSINEPADIYIGNQAWAIMRLVAFSYTYHYLNWFSKTSIIGWHRVSPLWLITVFSTWIFAVGIYLWDYTLGLLSLSFLSMLHVFLEFPLNHKTFIGIGQQLVKWAPSRKSP